MPLQVHDQSPEARLNATHWPMLHALAAGTAAMRKAGMLYLPEETRESKEDWELRLRTATLFPAFARTISVMTGKPFSKQLTLSEDASEVMRQWLDDCDLQDNNLHSFAADLLAEALTYGLAGVLVEYPKTQTEKPNTLADAQENGQRPYLVRIAHDDILGWKSERINGVLTLTQLRLRFSTESDDGEYGTVKRQQVRVLMPGLQQTFDITDKGPVLIDEAVTSIRAIPFVPFYGRKKAYMGGESPLLDLAFLNIKHWQHQSDQDDSARFARKRLLVLSGVDDDSSIVTAANYAIKLPTGASVQVVQGSAESVAIGRTELQALEAQMIQTGAELLVQRPGAMATATQSNNEAEANKSDLQRITEQFEDGLNTAIAFMADYANSNKGSEKIISGSVNLFKDFGAGSLSDASAQLIVAMQQGGLITKQTAIIEQQRRGILAANIDPETELGNVAEEGPALGSMGAGGGVG